MICMIVVLQGVDVVFDLVDINIAMPLEFVQKSCQNFIELLDSKKEGCHVRYQCLM